MIGNGSNDFFTRMSNIRNPEIDKAIIVKILM